MSMLPCNQSFVKGISDIICRLQNTAYADKALISLEMACTFCDDGLVMQVFRKFNNEIQTSEVEFVQRASKDLQALLEQEAARTAEVSRKILSRKEEDIVPEPMEVDTDQTTVVEEQTITRKRKKEETKGLEEPPAKRQKIETQTAPAVETFPAEEVRVSPLDIIQKIAGNLSAAQKNLIFNTLLESKSSHAARFREAIIRNDLQDMPAVDPEFAQLYRSTFGKSLVQTQEALLAWEAQLKTDKCVKTATLEYRLYTALQRLKELPQEFDALPKTVREYFTKSDGSQIQGSEILKNQQLCKQVLKAIRAHNLVCLKNEGIRVYRNKSSLESLLRTGKGVIERLKAKASTVSELRFFFNKKITHIPIEIAYFKNLIQLDCYRCSALITFPPEIGQLANLQVFNCESLSSLISLPPEIGNLANLHTFRCRGCLSLVSLPTEIDNLTKLEKVDFSNCWSLTSWPTAMEKLKNIDSLFISCCPNLRLSREQAERFKGIREFWCSSCSLPPEMHPPYPRNWRIL